MPETPEPSAASAAGADQSRVPEPRDPDRMPAWIPRLIGLIIFAVLGTWAGIWVLLKLRSLLVTILISVFVSFAFEPAVQYMARRGWRRGAATGLVFAVAALSGLMFVAVTLPPLAIQTASLVGRVPVWLVDLSRFLDNQFGLDVDLSNLVRDVVDVRATIQSYAASLAGGVLGIGSAVLGLLLQLLTMALFTFYLLADGPRVRRAILSVIRPERQDEVAYMWEVAIEKTGGYVYSRSLLGLFSALFTYVALRTIAVPFALPLAIWVGVVSQFLPAIGTYIAAVVPVFIAFTTEPIKALFVVIALSGYQLVENYLLAPRVTARTMSLHPAVAFGAALAGASILGLVGAVIALPVAATIQAFVSTYVERYQVADDAFVENPAASRVTPQQSGRWSRLMGVVKPVEADPGSG